MSLATTNETSSAFAESTTIGHWKNRALNLWLKNSFLTHIGLKHLSKQPQLTDQT